MVVTDQVQIPQASLNDVAEYFVGRLLYLSVGEGNDSVTLSTADVSTPVQMLSTERNLLRNSMTTTDGFFKVKFRLTTGVPVTQPLSYQQIGIHDEPDKATGIRWAKTLPVAIEKDVNSQHDVIISGRIIEL